MIASETTGGDVAMLSAETEAVLKEAAALRAALHRGRTLRQVLMLLFLVFVVGITVAFYRLGAKVYDKAYLDQLAELAQKRLDQNADSYSRDLQQVVDEVRPVLMDTVSKQATRDTPAYLQGMQREGKAFSYNLQRKALAKIDELQERAIAKNQALFDKDFPVLNDARVKLRLSANLRVAAEGVANKYYIKELGNSLDELYTLWDSFPAAKKAEGETPPLDQLLSSLVNLLSIRVTKPPPQQ